MSRSCNTQMFDSPIKTPRAAKMRRLEPTPATSKPIGSCEVQPISEALSRFHSLLAEFEARSSPLQQSQAPATPPSAPLDTGSSPVDCQVQKSPFCDDTSTTVGDWSQSSDTSPLSEPTEFLPVRNACITFRRKVNKSKKTLQLRGKVEKRRIENTLREPQMRKSKVLAVTEKPSAVLSVDEVHCNDTLLTRFPVKVFKSATSWSCIGSLQGGVPVVAAGDPKFTGGFCMVPIKPQGAIEIECLQLSAR